MDAKKRKIGEYEVIDILIDGKIAVVVCEHSCIWDEGSRISCPICGIYRETYGEIENNCKHDWKQVQPYGEESTLYQCKKCKIVKVDY